LPHNLYTADQVRELDRRAIDECSIPGATLMERAGAAAFAVLRQRWPRARQLAVACGVGNNGGDGFVLARLAHAAGFLPRLLQVGDPQRLRGEALAAAQRLAVAGIRVEPFAAERLADVDVIVDAVLGTGLSGAVRDLWREAIDAINQAGAPVLALDIPSGLCADSGAELGAAVHAAATVTFIGVKRGLLSGRGPACCGTLHFNDLGVPARVYEGLEPAARRLDCAGLRGGLTRRPRDAHKGQFGHVVVIGGDHGMAGAVTLAAHAAARVGAGLVSVATRRLHATAVSGAVPEIMSHAVESSAELLALMTRASVVAIGPGLGQGEWGHRMWAAARELELPLVVDADALNLLAVDAQRRDDWVLTPHPGEAARLLSSTAAAVQRDRFAALDKLRDQYGGTVVLKGAGTLVGGPTPAPGVCTAGNPGMASGGMGDVLTGIIAGLLAQGTAAETGAELGACLHALAADRAAARGGERGLLASDLIGELRGLVNP